MSEEEPVIFNLFIRPEIKLAKKKTAQVQKVAGDRAEHYKDTKSTIAKGVRLFELDRDGNRLAEGKERTALSGSATLISDDLVIQSDLIELFGEDFIFAV